MKDTSPSEIRWQAICLLTAFCATLLGAALVHWVPSVGGLILGAGCYLGGRIDYRLKIEKQAREQEEEDGYPDRLS